VKGAATDCAAVYLQPVVGELLCTSLPAPEVPFAMVARRAASARVARKTTRVATKKVARKATRKATKKVTKRVKKVRKVSVIAKGKLAKASVFKGKKVKTASGLKASAEDCVEEGERCGEEGIREADRSLDEGRDGGS